MSRPSSPIQYPSARPAASGSHDPDWPLPGLAAGTPSIASSALLGPGGCVDILHGGERYILRQTRAGKLILTK